MLKQYFIIPKYNWKVYVYYYVTCYYLNEILTKLRSMGCTGKYLEDAYRNMSSCQLNSGITYSNNAQKHSVEKYNINPFSEEAAYLAGFIGQKMYPKVKYFLCKCHCK